MSEIWDSFYQTFIFEDRYLYFLEGIKFTLIGSMSNSVGETKTYDK